MADQDYPDLYAALEVSALRAADAAVAFEAMLGGTETQSVPVNGFGNQPTLAGRVKAYLDLISQTLESAAMTELRSLVRPVDNPSHLADADILSVVDQEGGRLMGVTRNLFETLGFLLRSNVSGTSIGDNEGGVSFYSDAEKTLVGPVEFRWVNYPGIHVMDTEGAVLKTLSGPDLTSSSSSTDSDPLNGRLSFSPLVVTAAGSDALIHVEGILPRRQLADQVVASLASTTTPAVSRGLVLPVSQTRFGDTAVLNIRSKADVNKRRFMNLTLRDVPVQVGSPVIKVLVIGDSIMNYGGAFLLKGYLEALGFAPQFIGTMVGAGPTESSGGTGGIVGEARHGWQARDYTYALSRKGVVAAGSEAAYLAMSKADKLGVNPFVRVAVAGDSADLVRNGYVFDPAFYQSRFALDTPDVVVSAMGTNDALNIASPDMYEATLEADRIMHSQILAAWPLARVLRVLPGTAIDTARDTLWTANYTNLIAGIQQSAKDLGARVTVAPMWALTSPEVGYGLPSGSADPDGFISGNWSDDIHPIGASRYGYYQAMAPYVAALKLNLV